MAKDASPKKPARNGIETSGPPPLMSQRFAFDPSQSQTIQPDPVQGPLSPRIEELDDPEDSDRERSSRKKGKGKESRDTKSRRYTIEPGEFEEEFVLSKDTDAEDEDGESLFEKVQTSERFLESVSQHPEEWCNAIRTMATSIAAYHEQISDLTQNVHSGKQHLASVTQQLKESSTMLRGQQEEVKRLRHLREKYRDLADDRAEEIFDLKEELSAKATTEEDPKEMEYVDSDDDRRPKLTKRATAPVSIAASKAHGSSRRNTPAVTDSILGKSKNKWPDVKEFHGTEGSKFYEAWCTKLNSKFRNSWELYPDEQSKIDYIRDHCEDVAYDVIKARSVDITAPNYYPNADEMIHDLDSLFAEVDREQRAEAELQNPKFAMGVKDPKESFPAFYARFTAEIAPLNLTDSSKRSHLKRLISWRLRSRIMDGTVSTDFPALVARLRQLDTELRINDEAREIAPKKAVSGGTFAATSGSRGGSSTTSNSRPRVGGNQSTTGPGSRYRIPEHQAQALKKQGRCYKCLESGHRHYDDNAPDACKLAKWPTKEDVAVKLAAFGFEISGANTGPPSELSSGN